MLSKAVDTPGPAVISISPSGSSGRRTGISMPTRRSGIFSRDTPYASPLPDQGEGGGEGKGKEQAL